MDNLKFELQAILRKLYILLPVDLAFDCSKHFLVCLDNAGYLSPEEFVNLKAISKAYSDILGG